MPGCCSISSMTASPSWCSPSQKMRQPLLAHPSGRHRNAFRTLSPSPHLTLLRFECLFNHVSCDRLRWSPDARCHQTSAEHHPNSAQHVLDLSCTQQVAFIQAAAILKARSYCMQLPQWVFNPDQVRLYKALVQSDVISHWTT